MAYALRNYLAETGMELKEFLQSPMGDRLMDRYGYQSEFRIDNVVHKFKALI